MGSKWRASTWGDELSLEYGKSLKGYRESKGSIQVFGSNGAVGWTDKILADGPGVILGRKGAYRGVQYTKAPFFVIDTAYYLKPKRELDMRWLYYAVIHHKLGEIDDGSPIPSTTRAAVYVQDVKIPPLPEQKAIAHILGSLDDKIELNRKMNDTLEAMAQALFKSWFVDFDPVIDNALAAGNPIPEALAPRVEVRRKVQQEQLELFNRHADLFPSAFTETDELGWIPEGWKVSTIGEEVDTVGGGTPSTKNPDFWEDGEYSWVTPKDFSSLQDKVLLASHRYLTESGLAKISSGLLPKGSVLMSSRAPVGYLAINQIETAINQGFIAMICNKRLPAEFVLQWADSTMDDIKRAAGGSTFAEISKKAFRPFKVILPSERALMAYKKQVAPLYSKIAENAVASSTLAKLRDTLLPTLISGEVRPLNIETLAQEVPS